MSSNEIAINVERLSKCYPIYNHPKDRLKQYVFPPIQGILGIQQRQYYKEFWALRDISFQIKRGDTVGIIGRNGAGKSTLLQILCGTLTPTSGTFQTNGRIAALLELGSGFNPEFTGRQNVYLNASILGLEKNEIDERFDQIAAFADIGEFIDQPVKTYSSGMYVRLAFAVIAHVDADILVVDEALAVGDAIFTQKCMRYIRAFQESGTLLFVSHDTSSVQNLCESAIWIDGGSIRQHGNSKKVSEAYLQFTLQQLYGPEVELKAHRENAIAGEGHEHESGEGESSENNKAAVASKVDLPDYSSDYSFADNMFSAKGFFTGDAEIKGVSIENLSPNSIPGAFKGWDEVRLTVKAAAKSTLARPIIGFLLRDRLGQDLLGENTLVVTESKPVSADSSQELTATFEFILPMLKDGDYTIMCSIADGDLYSHVQHHWVHDALLMHVKNSRVQYGIVGVPYKRISLDVGGGYES